MPSSVCQHALYFLGRFGVVEISIWNASFVFRNVDLTDLTDLFITLWRVFLPKVGGSIDLHITDAVANNHLEVVLFAIGRCFKMMFEE